MSNSGYFKFPRELFNSPIWASLSFEYRHIFMTILFECAFEETTQNDHGVLIKLKPGQFLTTYRELVKICNENLSKDDKPINLPLVQRALALFKKVNFSIQETIHVKTVITITEPSVCKVNNFNNDTRFDTTSIQDRYTKEEYKNLRKEKEEEKDDQKVVPLNEKLEKKVDSYENPEEKTSDNPSEKPEISEKRSDNIWSVSVENQKLKKQKLKRQVIISKEALALFESFCQSLERNYPHSKDRPTNQQAAKFDSLLNKKYTSEEIIKVFSWAHVNGNDYFKQRSEEISFCTTIKNFKQMHTASLLHSKTKGVRINDDIEL